MSFNVTRDATLQLSNDVTGINCIFTVYFLTLFYFMQMTQNRVLLLWERDGVENSELLLVRAIEFLLF